MKRQIPLALIISLIGLAVYYSAFSRPAVAEEFYRGKTLRFIVGYAPGAREPRSKPEKYVDASYLKTALRELGWQ